MIDWAESLRLFNTEPNRLRTTSRVAVICDCEGCNNVGSKRLCSTKWVTDGQMPWICKSCEVSRTSKKRWLDPEFRDKVIGGLKANSSIGEAVKQRWADGKYVDMPDKVSAASKLRWQDPEFRASISDKAKLWWDDPANRAMVTAAASAALKRQWVDDHAGLTERNRRRWDDPEFRRKMLKSAETLRTPACRAKMSRIIKATMTPERRAASSIISKRLWTNARFVDSVHAGLDRAKPRMSALSKTRWADSAYRAKIVTTSKQTWSDPDHKAKMVALAKQTWSNPDYKAKMAALAKQTWSNPDYKAKMAVIRSQQPRVSSIQTVLYSMLDDLGVPYYREHQDKPADPQCVIGPYGFDCVVPRPGMPTLLIECHGDYWHGQSRAISNDKSKATYVANNLAGEYELKVLWEHEFSNHGKVVELLRYWLGITKLNNVPFRFDDVVIKPCMASDYRLLLSKYHYIANAGRGGIVYGAYLPDGDAEKLIAVSVFSSMVRHNVDTKGFGADAVRELSRLCIHPQHQQTNFASWFVSKCMKKLDKKYKLIISYCDTTFNHDGAVYKACNFTHDRTVPPDYWYVSGDGWAMHKKSMYAHAVKLGVTEAEFAAAGGYSKVYGREKLRFVYVRN